LSAYSAVLSDIVSPNQVKHQRMAINFWRNSTMNVKFGMLAGTSRCWGYCFYVDTVETPSILVLSVSGAAENLTNITSKRMASQKTINSRHTKCDS